MSKLFLAVFLSFFVLPLYSAGNSVPSNAYRHFEEYSDIKPTVHTKGTFGEHYSAVDTIPNPNPNAAIYHDNQWHLIQRQGLRLAQIDKAASEIYGYLLYSPDVNIVTRVNVNNKNDMDYFIARRSIKKFIKWADAVDHESTNMQFTDEGPYIKDQSGHYNVLGYSLQKDGTLTKEGSVTKKLTGLGQIIALAEFLGDWDINNRRNIGIQEQEYELKVFKIDNEAAFDYGKNTHYVESSKSIDNQLQNYLLTDEIMNMSWFQQEKHEMLVKIANADFSDTSTIASIIKNNITDNSCKDRERWLNFKFSQPEIKEKILSEQPKNTTALLPLFDPGSLKVQLEQINEADTYECGGENILQALRLRQAQLKEQLKSG